MAPIALVPYLTTRWHHLHWLQTWPPDSTTWISSKFDHQMAGYKFDHQMAPLALLTNLHTRLKSHALPDCLELPYWHYQLLVVGIFTRIVCQKEEKRIISQCKKKKKRCLPKKWSWASCWSMLAALPWENSATLTFSSDSFAKTFQLFQTFYSSSTFFKGNTDVTTLRRNLKFIK